MLKAKFENVKALIEKQKEKGNKKNVENLVIFLVILIITLIAINTIWKEDEEEINEETNMAGKTLATQNYEETNITEQENLERKLEDILGKIEGVGRVSILITYSETSQVVAMYNETQKESETEEADNGGGTRKITQIDSSKEVIYKEENGEKIPVTQKTILPKIEGAIITAEGAGNAQIKTFIIQAVEAATGLATHKIQVFTMQV